MIFAFDFIGKLYGNNFIIKYLELLQSVLCLNQIKLINMIRKSLSFYYTSVLYIYMDFTLTNWNLISNKYSWSTNICIVLQRHCSILKWMVYLNRNVFAEGAVILLGQNEIMACLLNHIWPPLYLLMAILWLAPRHSWNGSAFWNFSSSSQGHPSWTGCTTGRL